jgi:hypothetical protein
VAAGLFVPGGIGTLVGSEWLGIPQEFAGLIGGVGLILTVVLNPDGIGPRIVEQNQALWNKYVAGRIRFPGQRVHLAGGVGVSGRSPAAPEVSGADEGSVPVAGSTPVEAG